jgi:hypothetical protein
MKQFLKIFSLGLIIGLVFVDAAFAGGTFSFSVSCTVPAIPGVNAPLIEEETVKPKEVLQQTQKTEANKLEKPITETKEEQITDKTQQPMIIVKTVYDR